MSSMMKMVLGIVITALVVGGATYWLVNGKSTTDKTALQSSIDSLKNRVANLEKPTTSTATTPSTASTGNPTADWKTYTNTSLGFSFKYPATWKLQDDSAKSGDIFLTDTNKSYTVEGSTISPIVAQVVKDTSGASIDTYLTGGRSALKAILKSGTVTLGGKTAYVLQGTTPPTYHNTELVFLNGYVYSFSNNAKVAAADSQSAIDSITQIYTNLLSTVTFTK